MLPAIEVGKWLIGLFSPFFDETRTVVCGSMGEDNGVLNVSFRYMPPEAQKRPGAGSRDGTLEADVT